MVSKPPTRLVRLLGDWAPRGTGTSHALANALAELIDGARLPAGHRMPGQRTLAASLGIARGTVSRAFADLADSGHLVARPGSGTIVRHPRAPGRAAEGRLTSFDDDTSHVLDLSSGALPGSAAVASVLADVAAALRERHADDMGYHPAGLQPLREHLARMTTAQGLPTSPEEILVTAGSQQAVWLLASALTGPGSTVVVEDPAYRGALEALADHGALLRGVPMRPGGIDVGLLASAAASADLVYLQPALHNPTGVHTSAAARARIAEALAGTDALVVDDQSGADLSWTRSSRLRGMEGLIDPDRLLVVGTLSKLVWGGIRVGWVRGPRALIGSLTDLRRGLDLSGSVLDQLAALALVPGIDAQRDERRRVLTERFEALTARLGRAVPGWSWWLPAGGSGVWVDTGEDAVALGLRARARGIRLTAGPAFSPHDGHGTFLRLPVWLTDDQLDRAVRFLAETSSGKPQKNR
jgi:DNA-binding transcriptional MocR family regulator